MNILQLTTTLMNLHSKHGNIEIKLESLPISSIEFVHSIDGEHGSYIDLVADDGG